MRRMNYQQHERGVSAVEIVIGASILALLTVAAALTLALFVRSATDAKEKTIALYLAESGMEYIRQIRSEDWSIISGLTPGDTYYFAVSTTTLAVSATPEVFDNYYSRSFYLTDLYRDANDDITSSTTPGATIDTGAYYVTVVVDYALSTGTSTVELSAILTNLHNE